MSNRPAPARWQPSLLILLLAVFSLSACSIDAPFAPPAAPSDVTIVVTYIVAPAPTATPVTPVPTPTPPPSPTAAETPTLPPPTAVPSQCPAPGAPTPPARPDAFNAFVDTLASFLSAGASITATRQLLADWGVGSADKSGAALPGGASYARLLPGEEPQLVVALANPAAQPGDAVQGDLAIYACAGGAVQAVYHALADPAHNGFFGYPRVVSSEDVTGDGLAELSFVMGDCGVHTCYDTIEILSAGAGGAGGTIANIIPDFAALPYPNFSFASASGGAARDLLAQVGQIGSVGAGPQRAATETWSYDGAVYARTNTAVEPPVYRIHALHDADAAFRRKDYARAGELYERAAADPNLKAWEGSAPLRDEDKVLGAFARFRQIELAAAQGDAAAAKAAYEALAISAPEGSPGETYAKLAEAFYAVFGSSGDYAQSCAAAVRFAEKAANTYILLGTQTFGYANYDYQPRDMCIQVDP